MKRHRLQVLLSLVIVCSVNAFAQSPKANKIDDLVNAFVQAGQFSGVVLASEDGKIIYEKGFGLANADFKIPNRPDTRIGIASITKPMTKVIMIRLIEGGKMALADKLSKYIPDFPNGDKITIEMLARHRSGILHRVMPPEMETVSYTSAEFVEKVKESKLAFEPGTQSLYSSGGYAVLARCLEIVSGKSYAQLLQEYVFVPADMRDSLDFNSEPVMERRAQDYLLDANGYINAPLKDYSFLVGAGSVFSTALDLHKFGLAALDGKYGAGSKASLIGQTNISSNGSTNGHRSYFEIANDKKYGYVLLSNLASGAFDVISQGLREILQGREAVMKSVATPKIDSAANKNLPAFLGKYRRSDGGGEFDMRLRNGNLYAGDIKLFSVKPGCFFEYKFFGEVCFLREAAGSIKEIKWKGLGFDLTWVRQTPVAAK